MRSPLLLAALIILTLCGTADAGLIFKGKRKAQSSYRSYEQLTVSPNGYNYSYSESCKNGVCPTVVPAAPFITPSPLPSTTPGEAKPERATPGTKKISTQDDKEVINDALAEVNELRARRGLRPYIHDPLLTEGAHRIATVRARGLVFGHLSNDFSLLPQGASARVTGCAAYPPSYGWLSCAVYDNYTYAGAAWVMGVDGKRYMHLVAR